MLQKHTGRLDSDSRAVSPVIGVVLMVGIVVALGAVVGAAVLGVGVGVGDTAPNAQFEVSTGVDSDTGANYVQVDHRAGETIDSDRFEYALNGDTEALTALPSGESFPDSVSAGDTTQLTNDVGETEPTTGDTFTLRWVSEDGETSSVLVEEELEFE